MPTPSRAVLSLAIRNCKELGGHTLYQCLQETLGDANSIRGVQETIIRSLAIHVVSVAAYGHVLNLQGLTKTRSSILFLQILSSLIFPTLPFLQLLFRVVTVSAWTFRRRQISVRQCMSACLGVHIQAGEILIPLRKIGRNSLSWKRRKCDLLWFGRLVVLLALLVQCVGSTAIWFRTIFVYGDRTNLYGYIDERTFEAVIGGIASVLNSICILTLNLDWMYVSEDSQDSGSIELSHEQLHSTEISTKSASQSEATNERSQEIHPFTSSWANIWRIWRQQNTAFSTKLSTTFPENLQVCLEHAFLAPYMVVFVSLYWNIKWRWQPPPISELLGKQTTERTLGWLEDEEHPLTVNKWLVLFFWCQAPSPFPLLTVLHFILIIRILLRDVIFIAIQLFANCPFLDRSVKAVSRFHTLLLSGRTILSFPFVLGLIIPVALRWEAIASSVRVLKDQETVFNQGADRLDRMYVSTYMYKDPWYDKMYIL